MIKMKKKLLSLVMTAAMVTSLFAGLTISASATNGTWSGSGTSADPYQIADLADLNAIANGNAANNGYSGVYFRLTADIDTTTGTWNGIGTFSKGTASTSSPYATTSSVGFAGTLDGAVYDNEGNITSVHSIDVDRTVSSDGAGGVVNYLAPSGTVKNLEVTGSISITSGVDAVGGVVGYNSGTINNVKNSASVKTSGTSVAAYNVGGITGFNNGYYSTDGTPASSGLKGIIANSSNSGEIQGYSKVGGVAGENSGTISFCSNTGKVTCTQSGKNGSGGIAGRNGNNNTAKEKGKIYNCYNRGNISSGTGKWCGGISGFNNSLSVVLNCYNTGTFTANSYKNPIIGNNENYTQINANDNYTSVSGGTGTAIEKGEYRTDMNASDGVFLALLNNNAVPDSVWAYSASVNDGYPYHGSLASVPSPTSYGASNNYSVIFLGGSNANDSNAGNVSTAPVATLKEAVTKAGNSTVSTVYIAVQDTVSVTGTDLAYGRGTTVKWAKNSSTGPMFSVEDGGSLAVGGLAFNGQYDSNTSVDTIFKVKSGGEFAIRYNASTANCGTAIDATDGGDVTINRSTIDATNYSVKVGEGDCKIGAGTGQSIAINKPVYLNNTSGNSDAYITLDSALTSLTTVECANPATNIEVVHSSSVSILTNSLSNLDYVNSQYSISSSIYTSILPLYYAIRLS